ncbi:MAG: hypothetical protein LUE93_07710 [Bacteroides sp.]|nr:hypothetical protein [Bacteroides sp.]
MRKVSATVSVLMGGGTPAVQPDLYLEGKGVVLNSNSGIIPMSKLPSDIRKEINGKYPENSILRVYASEGVRGITYRIILRTVTGIEKALVYQS